MNRFKRPRHRVALLLLQRRWSDAWTRILITPSTTTLRARRSSSSKVAKPVCSPGVSQSTMPFCPRIPILSECGREMREMWVVVVVVGGASEGSHKASWAVGRWRGSRAMMLDKGFSLIGNRVPGRTLKLDFKVRVLLGESGGVVDAKRG